MGEIMQSVRYAVIPIITEICKKKELGRQCTILSVLLFLEVHYDEIKIHLRHCSTV